MARNKKFQTNFSGGVLSPSVLGRTDIPAYGNAMSVGRNIVVEAAGGVKRRPGTVFIREYLDMDYVRLFPFRFNTEQQYLIVMYEDPLDPNAGYIDIYRDNVLQTQLVSQYNAAAIKRIDFAQSADVMIITDGEHEPHVLRRLGADNNWEILPAPIINPPQHKCDEEEPPVCEDVWSAANGYPQFCTFHVGRLWFAGSKTQPQSVWSSKAQDFFNFDVGIGDPADSIQEILDTDQINPIVGIYSERRLQIYTTGSEFTNTATVMTPTTSQWKRQSNYGSYGSVQPVSLDGGTLFLDRTGRTIRNFIYNEGEDGYTSDSISMLAEHLIINPTAMGVLRGRTLEASSFVFVVNSTGTIATLNLMRSVEMAAWTEWVTQGNFKDIVVVGENTYLLVERHGSWILEELTDAVATDSGSVNHSLNDVESEPVRSDTDNFLGINYDRDGRGQIVIVWDGEVVYKMDDFKENPEESVTVIDLVYKGFRAFSSDGSIRELYFPDRQFTNWQMFSLTQTTVLDTGTNYIQGLPHLIGRNVTMVLDGAVFPDEIVVSGDELPGGGYIKTYPDGSTWRYDAADPKTLIYQERLNGNTERTDGHYEGAYHSQLSESDNGFEIEDLTYLERGVVEQIDDQTVTPGEVIFNTPGNHDFTVPANVTSIKVKRIGAGGAGGGAEQSNGSTPLCTAGGGYAGQEFEEDLAVTPGQVISCTCGTGGIGQDQNSTGGHTGQAGTATLFPGLATAYGGAGGHGRFNDETNGYKGGQVDQTVSATTFKGYWGLSTSEGAGGSGYGRITAGSASAGRHGAGGGGSAVARTITSLAGNGGSGYIKISWEGTGGIKTEEYFRTRKMVLEEVDLPVTDGVVPVPRSYSVGQAGLWFGVEIETMPLSIGTSVHEVKRIVSCNVTYKNSAGLIVENIDIFNKSFGAEMLDRREPLETGTKKVRLLGYNKRTTIQIRQDAPLPMTLLSLDMEVKY